MNSINILGINISNVSFSEGVDLVKMWLTAGSGKHYIVTPNPEFVMQARKDGEFKDILNKADLAIPDGVGLIWAGKILKTPFKKRVTGVDFMLRLCEMAEKEGFTIGLLGGRDGAAEKTAEKLTEKFPDLKITFVKEEWEKDLACQGVTLSSGQGDTLAEVNLLFVAFGAPKQEKWIADNINSISVNTAMGVGGAFDYLNGKIPRPPKWMRNLGLEWLYRLIREPWRFQRQQAIWRFAFLILKQKLDFIELAHFTKASKIRK